MKKTLAAACAALCALTFSACSGETDPSPETSGTYTEISASEDVSVTSDETEQTETSSETETEAQAETVLCEDIANAVMAAVELPSMAEVGADRIGMYLDLTIPDGCDFSMYICGSGGFADEVFIINTAGMSVDDIKAAAEKRIETRKKDFEGYNPDEYDKLENYFSAEKDGYYMYAVTCDNSACESVFDEYVK
ncbi:DUF4358 domain-containing protein [Huintestinicola sp.]|uniref:DUF4358 domain-containing protein n=1 Tax=Huintestinicola sp. TaxID=2981661 RepID=UPI003D7D0325